MSTLASILTTIISGVLPTRLTIPALSWGTTSSRSPELPTRIRKVVINLLQSLDYTPPIVDSEMRAALSQSLRSEFIEYSSNKFWYDKVCIQSAAMADLSYCGHSPDVQLQVARFTWFMIYFDDLCHRFPTSLETFQRCVLTGTLVNEIPVLQHFREHLTNMYYLWDSIPANCITTSAMEYINGCALEESPNIRSMQLSRTAHSWPSYLRTKTGVSAAYAFMIFPKDRHPNISSYIQVIGDISQFIDLTNDVLSFYKETLAGEKQNYIHNRAYISGNSVEVTLQEVVQDVISIHSRITKTLKNTEESLSWKRFVNGYLAFHTTQTRYRLHELGVY